MQNNFIVKIILLTYVLFVCISTFAETILVKDINELNKANKYAKPGDIIILQNGKWINVTIQLDCAGTKEKPIIFKAQTQGRVFISGNSKMLIGGSFMVVDGLYFTDGYSGKDAVITYRIDKKQVANNCRVTNCAINNFNNPKRLVENYWVAFYGKNNRLDNSSFVNKKNIGVLLAVILDDVRSRENFHSIDHNYFGVRLPLASNGGEIIRVGVSEHCQYNSNTNIENNYFEHCDGETEIISIKSCKNYIRKNIFKECQGSVVLRHGDYNTVENNIFLGNYKEGTGGVRIINKGQWVTNNFFYKCRGVGFRSPIAIMNGIVNSPANRYVEVTDAVVCNNSFYECSPISFGIGSDTERTVVPKNVLLINNLFYNTKDKVLYNAYDSINEMTFGGNIVSKSIEQELTYGFTKTAISVQKIGDLTIPIGKNIVGIKIEDSLQEIEKVRLQTSLSSRLGLSNASPINSISANATGAKWYKLNTITLAKKTMKVNCKSSVELIQMLAKDNNEKLIINLTGNAYHFYAPLVINQDVTLISNSKQTIRFTSSMDNAKFTIIINAGYKLSLQNIQLDLLTVATKVFITTDTLGSSNHSSFFMNGCKIKNVSKTFFNAAKSSMCDSIIISNCTFLNNKATLFKLDEETDNKGFYNVENLKLTNCIFTENRAPFFTILRSGKDESTMGPTVHFSNNKTVDCFTENNLPLIDINGVQISFLEYNIFSNTNTSKTLIKYRDNVNAVHLFKKNYLDNSGGVEVNKYVTIIK